MTTQLSKLIKTAGVAALAAVATVSVAPAAMAQTVAVPAISFPQAGTTWGCRFYGTCPNVEVVTKDAQ